MAFNLSRNELMQGQANRAKAQETENSFALENGGTSVTPSTDLDKTGTFRKAGPMGAFAMSLANDPALADYVFGQWKPQFMQSPDGMNFYPPPPPPEPAAGAPAPEGEA